MSFFTSLFTLFYSKLYTTSKSFYILALRIIGVSLHEGHKRFQSGLPTVLVVSHEASSTGAPILALNIVHHLSSTHNVVVLLIKGGPLRSSFLSSSSYLLTCRRSYIDSFLIRRALRRLSNVNHIEFAIVNSVVSAPALIALRSQGIACITLVHEFVSYIKPLSIFSEVSLWSSKIVCSTYLTWHDVLSYCPHLRDLPVAYLPQGRSLTPDQLLLADVQDPSPILESDPSSQFLSQLRANTLLVLGAGAVQPRKGIDHFISIANYIVNRNKELDVVFVWLGSGYEPDNDFNVSIWLKDQILRSGLSNQFYMLPSTTAYSDFISRSNLFIISSRLDPLPNVAIDALLASTPVLCFEQACGFAELFSSVPELHNACVAPYLDDFDLANKAFLLLSDNEYLAHISNLSYSSALNWFDMKSYVRSLLLLGKSAASTVLDNNIALHSIFHNSLLAPGYYLPSSSKISIDTCQRYLLSWSTNIQPRKPLPGFNPGIYRDHHSDLIGHSDPLVHWFNASKPTGPWTVPIINQDTSVSRLPKSSEVALHIHVFYIDLLGPILASLGFNTLRPSIFITYSNPSILEAILSILDDHGYHADVFLVPNRGRDIGPLIDLGQHLDSSFNFYGHLHTKKSVLIPNSLASTWRTFLLVNLLGRPDNPMLDRILSTMSTTSDLGLVFPDDPGSNNWSSNLPYAQSLAKKLDISFLPSSINFPVGSMFWARKGALSRLYDIGLSWSDYPSEPLGYDGSILHAIERLIPIICTESGMDYAMTHVNGITR